MASGKIIWIGAGAVVIWAAYRHGWHFIFSPAGAFVVFAAIVWIMHYFGGWHATFRRVLPAVILVAIGSAVYFGAKSAYCSTLGAATHRCVRHSASR